MAEIVFVSLFLGLVAGVHPLELRADPAIHTIRVTLGADEVATLRQAPWRTTVDFGTNLDPRELTAIGYDEKGNEIARASQIINLPHPFADVAIAVKRDGEVPSAVELVGRHLEFMNPVSAIVELDGKPLRVENFSAHLPNVNWTKPHVISAEMTFDDGMIARREILLTGASYVSGSELTPVLVAGNGRKLDRCFSADGTPLRTAAVEKTNALVLLVKDPDAREAQRALKTMYMIMEARADRLLFEREMELGKDTTERIIWPVARHFAATDQPAESLLFENSQEFDGREHSFAWLLGVPLQGKEYNDAARLFADAVAVAGLRTIMPARRRAVVLLLSDTKDESVHSPVVVRRYLESIGVPLFVWSLTGPRPDGAWGDVVDVSDRAKLHAAIDRLRTTIESQSIVWLPVDPLAALRVKADPRCGVSTVAKVQ